MSYAVVLPTIATTQALILEQSNGMGGGRDVGSQGEGGEGSSESPVNPGRLCRLDAGSHDDPFPFPRRLLKEREKEHHMFTSRVSNYPEKDCFIQAKRESAAAEVN